MSYALRPGDGAARLLAGASPGRQPPPGRFAFTKSSEAVQGAIKAIQQHCNYIEKDTRVLLGGRTRITSFEQVRQVRTVASDTAAEARRLLRKLEPEAPGVGGVPEDERRLQRLTHQKLAESLDQAAGELEVRWQAFVAADAAWDARRKAAEAAEARAAAAEAEAAAAASAADAADLERGQPLQQRAVAHEVALTQAEVDLHCALAEDYARDVEHVARSAQGLQRVMVDLAAHAASQGEALESIEAAVGQASGRTAQALEQIHETDERQKGSMKRVACLGFFVCTLSLALAFSVWR